MKMLDDNDHCYKDFASYDRTQLYFWGEQQWCLATIATTLTVVTNTDFEFRFDVTRSHSIVFHIVDSLPCLSSRQFSTMFII